MDILTFLKIKCVQCCQEFNLDLMSAMVIGNVFWFWNELAEIEQSESFKLLMRRWLTVKSSLVWLQWWPAFNKWNCVSDLWDEKIFWKKNATKTSQENWMKKLQTSP